MTVRPLQRQYNRNSYKVTSDLLTQGIIVLSRYYTGPRFHTPSDPDPDPLHHYPFVRVSFSRWKRNTE